MDVPNDKANEIKKEFNELPIERKLATLTHLEIVAASEAFDLATSWIKKVFDEIMPDSCSAHQSESQPTSTPTPGE